MAGSDDERLLIEAAQKDSRRFGELYERNFERVYAFIARRVRDRHEAEIEPRGLQGGARSLQLEPRESRFGLTRDAIGARRGVRMDPGHRIGG